MIFISPSTSGASGCDATKSDSSGAFPAATRNPTDVPVFLCASCSVCLCSFGVCARLLHATSQSWGLPTAASALPDPGTCTSEQVRRHWWPFIQSGPTWAQWVNASMDPNPGPRSGCWLCQRRRTRLLHLTQEGQELFQLQTGAFAAVLILNALNLLSRNNP